MTSLKKAVDGLGSSINRFKDQVKKVGVSTQIFIGMKKEPMIIPDSWITPKQKYETPMNWLFDEVIKPIEKVAVARKPIFTFTPSGQSFSFLRSNVVFNVKRTVMFLLLVASIISAISFAALNPYSLLFYIPTIALCLDFLRRTQPKRRSGWLMLKDIEDDL